MRRIRVIPSLLIQRGRLVKSVKFKDYTYVGDPINAVKIFNEKEVDEIVILDISATAEGRSPDLGMLRELAGEAFMPLAYGGGITTLSQIKELIQAGVEKVVLNTAAGENPALIKDAARYVGSQSIVVSVDVKKNMWGKYNVFVRNGSRNIRSTPWDFAKQAEEAGAGEILLNSIDRDGTFEGFDTTLISKVSANVKIPVVSVGGAASLNDFRLAIQNGASAVAAGSMFVFKGTHKAVLINYPEQSDLEKNLFEQ